MDRFIVGHATHPDWRAALALVVAQLESQLAVRSGPAPTLGLVYITDTYAAAAPALLAALRERWPGVAFSGTVGVGVAASGVEYFDEPGLVLMLAALPAAQFALFSGRQRLRLAQPATALVHADPTTPDLAEMVSELAARTQTGYLFGGIAASRTGHHVLFADGVLQGGLAGVAFTSEVSMVSRVTQGCQPVGRARRITACDGNVVTALDGEAALPALLADLGLSGLQDLRQAVPRLRQTLVALADPAQADQEAPARRGAFGVESRVRHLVGVDPARRALAVAEALTPGLTLTFCQRDVAAARRDLVRICSEIRDEVETRAERPRLAGAGAPPDSLPPMLGAIYVSCSGRGGPHFGGASAELQIVRHALGDVPLAGFFAAGEIGHHHLYGYTGVLTVFTQRLS